MSAKSAKDSSLKNIPIPIKFFFQAPTAGQVSLVGNFNNWGPTAMPMRKGTDGGWQNDPGTQQNLKNALGGENYVRTGAAAPVRLPLRA